MDYVTIRYIDKKPKLKNPILIEGLPGIGNVGKLAVEHLIDKTNAVKFAEIYSKDFPPQVLAPLPFVFCVHAESGHRLS